MTRIDLDSQRFVRTLEEVLRHGHPARFRAKGWSMHPTIRNGETITVAPLGLSPIRVGDVLLYRQGRAAIAHRVVRLRSSSGRPVELVLRGDAADFSDVPIAIEQVLGRVVGVGRLARPVRRGVLGRGWVRASARAIRRARAIRELAAVLLRAARSSGART